jgi:ZIP family zinc transporter
MLVQVILVAIGSGVIGTLVGGIIGVVIKKPSKTYISLMLSFAAGAMLGVSLFELLPKAYNEGGIVPALVGALLGVLFVFAINLFHKDEKCCDKSSKGLEIYAKKVCAENPEGEACKAAISASDKRKLKRMGVTIFIAMALHSLPEGLAIGAGEHLGIGLVLGIIFFLHFVPEGLAIAVPMKASGTKTWKVLLLCAAAGLPAVVGAIIAYYVGMISALLPYSLSFAAGAMLYVALSEMLPTAYNYSNRYKLISAITLIGAFLIIVFSWVM